MKSATLKSKLIGTVDQTISVAILHCIIRCLSPLYVTVLSHFSWNFIVFCLFCSISFLKVQTNLCFRERLPSQDFLQRHLSLFTLFTLCLQLCVHCSVVANPSHNAVVAFPVVLFEDKDKTVVGHWLITRAANCIQTQIIPY